jgi:hypothetical protein
MSLLPHYIASGETPANRLEKEIHRTNNTKISVSVFMQHSFYLVGHSIYHSKYQKSVL